MTFLYEYIHTSINESVLNSASFGANLRKFPVGFQHPARIAVITGLGFGATSPNIACTVSCRDTWDISHFHSPLMEAENGGGYKQPGTTSREAKCFGVHAVQGQSGRHFFSIYNIAENTHDKQGMMLARNKLWNLIQGRSNFLDFINSIFSLTKPLERKAS